MEKIQILADHLNCEVEDIKILEDSSFNYDGTDYLIYDDFQIDVLLYQLAEELFFEELKSVPEHLRDYVNKEEYIDDNIDFDLISSDYEEIQIEDDNFLEIYYIFRV